MRYTLYSDYSNSGTVQGTWTQLVPSERPRSARQTDAKKRPCAIFIAEVIFKGRS